MTIVATSWRESSNSREFCAKVLLCRSKSGFFPTHRWHKESTNPVWGWFDHSDVSHRNKTPTARGYAKLRICQGHMEPPTDTPTFLNNSICLQRQRRHTLPPIFAQTQSADAHFICRVQMGMLLKKMSLGYWIPRVEESPCHTLVMEPWGSYPTPLYWFLPS